jgi:uncharacterized protein (UPF0332 family)
MAQEQWESYLAKAKECVRSAHSASSRGLNNCAANRAYYAAYLAELAALQKFSPLTLPATGWQHFTVVKAFNHRLVTHKKIFDAKVIGQVAQLESLRIKGDYSAENVTGPESAECVTISRSLVQIIENKIRE